MLFLLLGGVYILFQPLKIKIDTTKKEVPILEIEDFEMYEVDTVGLMDFSMGKKAWKYVDRYELKEFSYNENTDNKIVSISAKNGIDKNDNLTLKGDVQYVTSDGVEFFTQKVLYNRKKGVAQATTPYEAIIQQGHIWGKTLYYDLKKKKVRSKNIYATYRLDGQRS